MSNNVVLVPLAQFRVQRDGKNVSPKIGEPFSFTAEEATEIRRLNPSGVRDPKNEKSEEGKVAPAAKAASVKKEKAAPASAPAVVEGAPEGNAETAGANEDL